MKLFEGQKGYNDIIVMTIIGGFVGALLITGIFIWQEVKDAECLKLSHKKQDVAQEAVQEDQEVVETITLDILGVPNLEGSVSFEQSDYDPSYFVLETNSSNDLEYGDNEHRVDLLEYHYGDTMDKEYLQTYVDKYDEYMQGDFAEYKVSLFVHDPVGKDEVARWYLTENSMNLADVELKYWNYCEAGCRLWPQKVLGDYIVWKNDLFASTGVGDKCYGPSGEPEYEDKAKQAKCETISKIDFLKNLNIEEKKYDISGEWKYYNNEEFEFGIEYLSDWSFDESYVDRENFRYTSFYFDTKGSDTINGYSLRVYESLDDLIGGDGYLNLEEWIESKEDNLFTYSKTQALGVDTYEGYWPSADTTYSFYAEHEGRIFNIDITWVYPNQPNKEKESGLPIFGEHAKRFLDNLQLVYPDIVEAVKSEISIRNVQVTMQEGNFAKGSISSGSPGGGANWYASKQDGVWIVDKITQDYPCHDGIFDVYPREFFSEQEIEYCQEHPY